MENYEQDQAAIREEIDTMKGKVDMVLEAIQALRAERTAVVQEIPVVTSQPVVSQLTVIEPVSIEPYATPEYRSRAPNATFGMPFSFMTADTPGASHLGGPIP